MSAQSTIRLILNLTNRHSRVGLFQKLQPSDPGRFIAVINTEHPSVEARLNALGVKAATKDASSLVGELLAQKMKELNLSVVELNRSKKVLYHGRVKAVIDALKENGVKVH